MTWMFVNAIWISFLKLGHTFQNLLLTPHNSPIHKEIQTQPAKVLVLEWKLFYTIPTMPHVSWIGLVVYMSSQHSWQFRFSDNWYLSPQKLVQSTYTTLKCSKNTLGNFDLWPCGLCSAYRKPAFLPSAFRRLFIGFQPSAENQPNSMKHKNKLTVLVRKKILKKKYFCL